MSDRNRRYCQMATASASNSFESFKHERVKVGACSQYLNNRTKIHPLLKLAYASESDESSECNFKLPGLLALLSPSI
jgi:hypothetical protein